MVFPCKNYIFDSFTIVDVGETAGYTLSLTRGSRPSRHTGSSSIPSFFPYPDPYVTGDFTTSTRWLGRWLVGSRSSNPLKVKMSDPRIQWLSCVLFHSSSCTYDCGTNGPSCRPASSTVLYSITWPVLSTRTTLMRPLPRTVSLRLDHLGIYKPVRGTKSVLSSVQEELFFTFKSHKGCETFHKTRNKTISGFITTV